MNQISIQKMLDGPRNAVFKVDVSLDGSGDYAIPQTIVDPAQLSRTGPNDAPLKRVRVDILDWDVQDGLSVNLLWDGAGSAPLWRMVGRSIEKAFHVGGLQNNADTPNGKITMTTSSVQAGVPLAATFKIHCVKQP